ncbi:MAG: DNA polymerase IV [Helicobacteraceae bacterium]|jgi:DNA polymerase-4|nr:DNA polymerase IV [Helicobacteraceae bacterium]
MIIHIDFDCFFVSAERTRNKALCGVPAVSANRNDAAIFGSNALKTSSKAQESLGAFSGACYYNKFGDGSWRDYFLEGKSVRGVVVAASYEARKYNIKTGTTLSEALKLCPELRILPTDMPFYMSLSRKTAEFLEARIPILEQYSIDEFFGSLDGFINEDETLRYLRNLQAEINKEFALPASIGASVNKSLAKLAAKSAKPFGVCVVKNSEIKDFIEDKPIRALAGIGRQMGAYLERYGVKTLGDVTRAPSLLDSFGKTGRDLLKELNGKAASQIAHKTARKQMGISRVFDPILDRQEALRRFLILCGHLAYHITMSKREPRAFTFSVGYRNSPSEHITIRSDRLFSEKTLCNLAKEAFGAIDKNPNDPINFLAISGGDFNDKPTSFNMLSWQDDYKNRAINEALSKTRAKYGYSVITYSKQTRP